MSRPLRVVRIYHSAVVSEFRWRDRLLRERYGHDLHLVCPPAWPEGGSDVEAEPEPTELPIHIVERRGRTAPNLFWYRTAQLAAVLAQVRPHVVDLHEEPFSLAAAGALRAIAAHAPDAAVCVYSAQNLPKRYPPPFSLIEQRMLRRAAAAYPCSSEAGDRLRARGFRDDIHVLALGVNIPAARAPAGGPLQVGFVGRLEPYKGAAVAVQAFCRAAAGRDMEMLVIGDGSERRRLEHQVSGAAVADRVRFLGALGQDQALAQMSRLDVLLVPSIATRTWKEQFGRVAAQGMAAGAVVVASDSGSLREVVADAGILVPEGDVDQFTQALARLADDPVLRARLAAQGRERAAASYSWDAIAAQMDQMYRQMLAQRR